MALKLPFFFPPCIHAHCHVTLGSHSVRRAHVPTHMTCFGQNEAGVMVCFWSLGLKRPMYSCLLFSISTFGMKRTFRGYPTGAARRMSNQEAELSHPSWASPAQLSQRPATPSHHQLIPDRRATLSVTQALWQELTYPTISSKQAKGW